MSDTKSSLVLKFPIVQEIWFRNEHERKEIVKFVSDLNYRGVFLLQEGAYSLTVEIVNPYVFSDFWYGCGVIFQRYDGY